MTEKQQRPQLREKWLFVADRDLRLISHNIKKRAKQLKVPIPDNFDEQLKPDTFVMS